MRWCKAVILLLAAGNSWAAGEYIVGGGVESDSADGLAAAVFGDVALADSTWLSGSAIRTEADLLLREQLETWYADIGIDHSFDPGGIRVGAAYWGDDNILDSRDARLGGYLRGESYYLAIDYEYRDLELELPAVDRLSRQDARFHANGIGLGARIDLFRSVDVSLRGIVYDYSVDLRLDQSRDLLNVISATRLSLINSLVDYRASIGLGIEAGQHRVEFDVIQWQGAVAGSITNSYSLRLLSPLGAASDIEFGLGYDDSENYGEVTILSVFLYFYGGG